MSAFRDADSANVQSLRHFVGRIGADGGASPATAPKSGVIRLNAV
jgi:hypothetical protein